MNFEKLQLKQLREFDCWIVTIRQTGKKNYQLLCSLGDDNYKVLVTQSNQIRQFKSLDSALKIADSLTSSDSDIIVKRVHHFG